MIIPDSTLKITHEYIKKAVSAGNTVIDATMGNGHDTLFLANLVGEKGKVFAFDIQKQAVVNTSDLLEKEGVSERAVLINDGHHNIEKYVDMPVNAVMFNLGYLPGGDHSIATKFETTAKAIEQSMNLLSPGGLISIGVYYGGDSGFEEKNALMEWIKTINYKEYTVLVLDYVNRPNCPPIAVMIEKK